MSIAERAKQMYERELQAQLESNHRDKYVAIEPESKSFFLGDSFIDAAMAAKAAYPDRKSFVLRIGHEAAFHIGASST
jgi:phosphoglycolate phosphatase-like HAD superfamily hydrolase